MSILRSCYCGSLLLLFVTIPARAFSFFPDPAPLTVNFIADATCANSPVSFFPTVSPSADSLRWDFGDGNSAKGWAPTHVFTKGGSFDVRVTAYLNGESASASNMINITASDLQIKIVSDTTGCACDFPINSYFCGEVYPFEVSAEINGGVAPQFQWVGPGGPLEGQTTATLRPDSAGYYYLVATDGGCAAYAGVNIREYNSLDERGHTWYFGQNAGAGFQSMATYGTGNLPGPVISPHGSSVMNNRNGQVLFSTDGYSIYDSWGDDITPPGGIGGDNTSTQSALIIPVPGDETLYYIFTTEEISASPTHDLRYSLFDTKLNNGFGGLVMYNQLLFSGSTERLTGSENWLIAHEYGNNSFRAYPITETGIGNPVISHIGSSHTTEVPEHGKGYMKLGPQNMLAVALSTPGVSNAVELFEFNPSTGKVTNFKMRDLKNPSGQVYGIEFSPGGNKLFATLRNGPTSKVYELVIQAGRNIFFGQAVSQPGEWGALQYAPDGLIYAAINGSENLATFGIVEDTALVSPLGVMQPFSIAAHSTLGLPNFIQNIAYPAVPTDLVVQGLCLGASTQFTATGKDSAIDKFDWVFGDGQAAIDASAQVAHLYAAPGAYEVMLTIRNKCKTPVATYQQQVVINDVPPNPSAAVAICAGDAQLDANPQDLPGLSYLWSTGERTETITVNQQAMYDVTITDAIGCSTDANFMAASNKPEVELGVDIAVCQNTSVAPLDAQNPGANYSWRINETPNGNTAQTQSINTSLPGTFEFTVVLTDPITNCFSKDSVVYTIHALPDFTVTSNSPIECQTNTGEITLTIESPSESLFNHSITGPSGPFAGSDRPAGTLFTTPATLATGMYAVTVSDQHSTCATMATINIEGVTSKPTLTQEGTLLTSSSTTGNQWLRNGVPIAGAVNTTYNADEPGSYMVRVWINGCAASFSDPTTVTDAEEDIHSSIHVYPNPTSGSVRVEVDFYFPDARAELYAATGLRKGNVALFREEDRMFGEIDMKHCPPGVYLLMIYTGKVKRIKKFSVL